MTENEKAYNVVGVVAEYNPFHNGHEYHLQQAKKLTGADACIVVMSGDFVQRGAPAIFDKYTRTAMALQGGADLVLEIPSLFATGSAEDFASASVSLLEQAGVVSHLCFGSECGSAEKLSAAASILAEEPEEYVDILRGRLRCGATYPQARAEALAACGVEDEELLSSPNNILGLEYIKALMKIGSAIEPVTIRREGAGYHDTEISPAAGTGSLSAFSSASAIRNVIHTSLENKENWRTKAVQDQLPQSSWDMLGQSCPVFPNDLSLLLNAAILTLSAGFEEYLDVSEELAARIRNMRLDFSSFEDRISGLKTRQYTYTRISRALIHILLDMKKEDAIQGRLAGYAPYARVLGFRRQSAWLLSDIKKRGRIPLITKTADAGRILEGTAWNMFQKDLCCSHLYQAVVQNKYHVLPKNEYTRSVVIL